MKIKSLLILTMTFIFLFSLAAGCAKEDDKGILGWILGAAGINTGSNSKRIFFTTGTWAGGDLGGISGADAKCNSDANKPSDGSTYKALIVGSTRTACTTANCSGGVSENQDWVLKPKTAYYRKDGITKIGTTNAAGIFIFSVLNGVTDDGTGATFDPGSWTGLSADWTAHANTCFDWGITSGSGSCGFTAPTDSTLISDNGLTGCGMPQHLFCVEQ